MQKVPFQRASITDAEINAVVSVLKSGWLTTGKVTLDFEEAFSTFLSTPPLNTPFAPPKTKIHSLAVNSNTSGMLLALSSIGITRGTAVICPVYTFSSTPLSVRHLGADVIFCDCERGGYNLDIAKLETILEEDAKGKKLIKAVIPTHIAGVPCDMKKIMALSEKYNIKVIEDAAHSFPSPTPLGYCGTIGNIGVFSFYATKTITTAEGGMVCTKDETLAKRISTLRLHGIDRDAWDRYTSEKASWEYDIIAEGYKCNLPDVLSAIGKEQLKRAVTLCEKRKKIVQEYNNAFEKLPALLTPPTKTGDACHLYLLRLQSNSLYIPRDDFARALQSKGLGISVHFIPMYRFTYWRNLYPTLQAKDFPNAEAAYNATISLPLWPDMSDDDVQYVIKCVTEVTLANLKDK